MKPHWKQLLAEEFNKDYFKKIATFVKSERKYKTIYPEPDELFKCFQITDYVDTKVVILGQDPYINGEANGLAFSIKEGFKIAPSLKQILDAIEDSCYDSLKLDYNTDLTYLAEQGVLLLNRMLTVEKGKPLSHKGIGWEIFTNKVIELLNLHPYNIVYILAGKEAQNMSSIIDPRHHIIELEHPAYACRQGRRWLYDDSFNKVNILLENQGRSPINW